MAYFCSQLTAEKSSTSVQSEALYTYIRMHFKNACVTCSWSIIPSINAHITEYLSSKVNPLTDGAGVGWGGMG